MFVYVILMPCRLGDAINEKIPYIDSNKTAAVAVTQQWTGTNCIYYNLRNGNIFQNADWNLKITQVKEAVQNHRKFDEAADAVALAYSQMVYLH